MRWTISMMSIYLGAYLYKDIMRTLQYYRDEVGNYGEKLFLRNQAIRTNSWNEFENFVRDTFPNTFDVDINEAKELAERILKLSKDEFNDWMTKNRINMLTSDLYSLDEGSIFYGSIVPPRDLQFIIGDGLEDAIKGCVTPSDIIFLTHHTIYWIDPIIKT